MSPTTTEASPLLGNGNMNGHPTSFSGRIAKFLKAENQPSWFASYKFFLFGSWMNVLLVFVPLSVIAHTLEWDAALQFAFSFISIMPLAALLGTATDQLSVKLGPTLSGLLNASFGNVVEILVGVAALMQDQMRIVQTSLLGSILGNLLLVLGCSFVAGFFRIPESKFGETAAQASSSLMTLACLTLVIPAAYHSAQLRNAGDGNHEVITSLRTGSTGLERDAELGLLKLSRGTAILLLIVYVGYLTFQLKTHEYLFRHEEMEQEEEEVPLMNVPAAASSLLICTVVTSFCADYLVASIEETADRYGIPKPFIGLILLPLVANAAEHVTSVWMALKNKMEISIGICVGSSIQIATFVIPLLVIVGWITGHELTLFFADFETIVLFVSVLLVQFLVQDGKSNYMEGLMLITLYLVIALAFWVSKE